MIDLIRHDAPAARPSQVIAEALVERYGPSQIATRAESIGLPQPLTDAIVAACCSTAIDGPAPYPMRGDGQDVDQASQLLFLS
jgi:hypothetical protein